MGNEQFFLALNSYYRRMYSQMRGQNAKKYGEDDRKHVVEFVERADLFIKNINQRRKTLRAIARAIVELQQGYLEMGAKSFLRPLTRTKLARSLEMHESTVSRATANKYVQLPNQEVVSFDFFFDNSLCVKDMIGQMIASEDPHSPLSDQQIAEMLQARGLNIARRTVVKYREAQKILSSRQRRM
jgi:RNA polymerase sigma-54 factor